ncbi:hypothetical protein MASR2M66_26310 [Chloroflexota bacterium]
METKLLENLAFIRLSIGFLGEREQFGWWQSSFFTQGSNSFLSPLFARTQMLAQFNGVSRSATLVHDERIGVGSVYHLFRLPEDLEQGLQKILRDTKFEERAREIIKNKETALDYLREQSKAASDKGVGPVRYGNINQLHNAKTWLSIAQLYLHAFEKGTAIFPYFSN